MKPLILKSICCITGFFTFITPAFAEFSAPKGENVGFEIAAKSDRSDRGFGVSRVELTMYMINNDGESSERSLTMSTLEVADEGFGDKSLVVFNSPAEVKDTKLLSHTHILDPDDQWLYLPALKRVKRISSANKSGPFVGSEFAFEDFTAQELNKFEYKFLKEEKCGEYTCAVIDRFPLYDNSGYTKQRSFIDTTHYQIRKIEFFDRRDKHLKTLFLNDYKLYKDQFWRPLEMYMDNHQKGKKTILKFEDYDFSVRLANRDFSKSSLK